MDYEIEADWLLNEYCNFNCEYCFDSSDKLKKYKGNAYTHKVVDAFNNTGIKWLIHMSGGEPLFFPNIVKLCSELTENHFISMNSNLSHNNIYQFGESVNPQKVRFIHCSIHIQERERLKLVKDFIDKYNFLKKKGFFVFASYVVTPSLMHKFRKDYILFKSEGVIIRPKAFHGSTYLWRETNNRILNKMRNMYSKFYPDSYTKKQKESLLRYNSESDNDRKADMSTEEMDIFKDIALGNWFEKYITEGLPSFKGKMCLAGKKFVKIDSSGDVKRCNTENENLGNIFNGDLKLYNSAKPCNSDYCTCPYFGQKYVINKD